MKFELTVLREAGYEESMLGLSLSYNQPIEKMPGVAVKLFDKDNGHNKFLESIAVWLDIRAARYWWQQFDTYRVGMTKQSESTMHTLTRQGLTNDDFAVPLSVTTLAHLNGMIALGQFDTLKAYLPEGFLQRRVICTNYKALRHIVAQRKAHRLWEWKAFCCLLREQLEHPEFAGV